MCGLPADQLAPAPHAVPAGYRQGIVLPAFETIDDGEEGRNTALKAIKSAWARLKLCRAGCGEEAAPNSFWLAGFLLRGTALQAMAEIGIPVSTLAALHGFT